MTDENGQPAVSAQVTLVPAGSRRSDLFKTAATDAGGHFSISGAAPGQYRLYAWEEVDVNAVRYDPEFLKPYESSALSLQLRERTGETVALKLIRTPPEP